MTSQLNFGAKGNSLTNLTKKKERGELTGLKTRNGGLGTSQSTERGREREKLTRSKIENGGLSKSQSKIEGIRNKDRDKEEKKEAKSADNLQVKADVVVREIRWHTLGLDKDFPGRGMFGYLKLGQFFLFLYTPLTFIICNFQISLSCIFKFCKAAFYL